ncbi:unnamed protein product [Agarophyton chilense]
MHPERSAKKPRTDSYRHLFSFARSSHHVSPPSAAEHPPPSPRPFSFHAASADLFHHHDDAHRELHPQPFHPDAPPQHPQPPRSEPVPVPVPVPHFAQPCQQNPPFQLPHDIFSRPSALTEIASQFVRSQTMPQLTEEWTRVDGLRDHLRRDFKIRRQNAAPK